jgi:ATP-dependent Clp protease protease subunit
VEYMYRLKGRLNRILATHTGKTSEQIEKDADRDYYMTAQEAADYGLVDKVMEKKVPKSKKETEASDDKSEDKS